MKLYFSPGACSLSPHIVAQEAGLILELEHVDLGTKRLKDGRDFLSINPKGYVPALELDNGELLTEGPAVVQYLGDLKPESRLVPPAGTSERYRLQELLGYVNSEIHKSYSPLFSPRTSPEQRSDREAYLRKRYALVDTILADNPYLLGARFSAADAYLFVVTTWAGYVKLDLSELENLTAFQDRVASRPAVQAAIAAERRRASA